MVILRLGSVNSFKPENLITVPAEFYGNETPLSSRETVLHLSSYSSRLFFRFVGFFYLSAIMVGVNIRRETESTCFLEPLAHLGAFEVHGVLFKSYEI
jgi:hypothetical protein